MHAGHGVLTTLPVPSQWRHVLCATWPYSSPWRCRQKRLPVPSHTSHLVTATHTHTRAVTDRHQINSYISCHHTCNTKQQQRSSSSSSSSSSRSRSRSAHSLHPQPLQQALQLEGKKSSSSSSSSSRYSLSQMLGQCAVATTHRAESRPRHIHSLVDARHDLLQRDDDGNDDVASLVARTASVTTPPPPSPPPPPRSPPPARTPKPQRAVRQRDCDGATHLRLRVGPVVKLKRAHGKADVEVEGELLVALAHFSPAPSPRILRRLSRPQHVHARC